MFTDKTVAEFLDALASREPVPGGGSTAALGGSLAAALVSMVCNLTIGKAGYEGVEGEMDALRTQAEALRAELMSLLEADTQVYEEVMAAYRLPRKSAEEKQARQAAIQQALQAAADVPLKIAARCAEVVRLALPAARMGNTWAVSDAGVGALMAEACTHAALLNVYVNLASIQDQAYVERTRARIAEITSGETDAKEHALAIVREKIGA